MKPFRRISYAAAIGAAALATMLACGDDDGSGPLPGGGGGADRTAPQPVDDLSLAFDSLANSVVFAWTAPRDDISNPRVDRYEIRYGGSFPFDWEQSTRVSNPPAPQDPGTAQQFTLPGPRHGRDLYASVRSYDAAGNESPSGSVAHVFVPGFSFEAVCFDPFSSQPIAGLDAVVTARSINEMTTGFDGRIALSDLSDGSLGVLIQSGSAPGPYHTFNDSFTLTSNTALMYAMIPYQPTDSPLYESMLAFLKTALFTPGSVHTVKTWLSLPVPFYAPAFVNGSGADYGSLALQAAQRWNERLGITLFTPVASDPAVGVLFEFLPRSVMGSVVGVTDYANDADGYPQKDRIRIVDDISDESRLYSIMMHELGHTIPLGHLPAGFIMYASQPLPSDITDDEVAVVQLLLAVPNGIILDKYDDAPPTP